MSTRETDSTAVPMRWIVIFLVLALGVGAAVILYVGGDLISAGGVLAAPLH